MRTLTGVISAVLAIILSICIILMILGVVPEINISIFHEPFIRFITQVTVFLYLFAAAAFWRI